MTQTHLLVGTGLFARPGEPLRNTAVVAGSLLPDAAIFVLFGWSKLAGIPERRVWDEIYFAEPWRTWVAAQNSVFVYAGLMIAGVVVLWAVRPLFRIGLFALFLALAALAHVALDFPVHHADAHRHLWPVSDWVFRSPVSYWDPAHHGRIFMVIEAVLAIALALWLFRRFHAWWVRALLALAATLYLAVPAYFLLVLGDAA